MRKEGGKKGGREERKGLLVSRISDESSRHN